jgi:hypothetical protein
MQPKRGRNLGGMLAFLHPLHRHYAHLFQTLVIQFPAVSFHKSFSNHPLFTILPLYAKLLTGE